jgi:chlorobactene glucosyltransferase
MSVVWVLTLSSIAFIAGLVITYWMHNQHHIDVVVKPVEMPQGESRPMVSAIVPARNEARNIRRCVQSLLGQTYPAYEVIVVDDRSTDETRSILQEMQSSIVSEGDLASPILRIIEGQDLPVGWAGKPHALWQGAGQARGEWLCFVDADTFLTPAALASAYLKAQEHGADLFTFLTDQELGSFWEKVVLPLVFLGLSVGFPANKVNDPFRPDAIANGQFILIHRDVYEATGGHETIRGRIDEDKALAELVKGSGYRLVIADGRQVASTRMYTNLPEMWEGWTKNIFLGLRDRLGLLMFGATLGLIGSLALPAWLIAGIAWLAWGGGLPAVMVTIQAVLLWVYLLSMRVQASRAFGIHPAYSLTVPVGALLFTSMMFASAAKVLSGQGVTWRGRTYK